MKEEKKEKLTDLTKKSKVVTPEDGVVREKDMYDVKHDAYGKYFKGNAKINSTSTSDPRITRPFAYGVCGLFFAIGVIVFLTASKIFGIILMITMIASFVKFKKDIDAIENELKNSGDYDDSKEAKIQVREAFKDEIKKDFSDATESTFTKTNTKNMSKATIPIYCVFSLVLSAIMYFLVEKIIGIIVLVICVISGLLFYGIISLLSKGE